MNIYPTPQLPLSFSMVTGPAGLYFMAGFYTAPEADANLSQASQTVQWGVDNAPFGAHAFIVAAAVGTVSGGAGPVQIKVSGIAVDEAGNRNASASEVIVADVTALATNKYVETVKKWVGQVTFTLENAPGSTRTAFAADFNYGFAKYEDGGNRDFTLDHFEVVGRCGATDTGFDIELLLHGDTGWTYHASAFVAGRTPVICTIGADYGADDNITSGEPFAYKRALLGQTVHGAGSEGFLIRVKTQATNSIEYLNAYVGVTLEP